MRCGLRRDDSKKKEILQLRGSPKNSVAGLAQRAGLPPRAVAPQAVNRRCRQAVAGEATEVQAAGRAGLDGSTNRSSLVRRELGIPPAAWRRTLCGLDLSG